MRPYILDSLFAPLSSLKGIGDKLAESLGRIMLGGQAIRPAQLRDLLFHLPTYYIDRSFCPDIARATENQIVTLKLRIIAHHPPPGRNNAPYRILAEDDSGEIELVFFHRFGDWLQRQLPVDEIRYISGKVEHFRGKIQMAHPDYILTATDFAKMPSVEAVYPAGQGVAQKIIQKAIRQALQRSPELDEWLDINHKAKTSWPTFHDALQQIHLPSQLDETQQQTVMERLAYDELLAHQLALGLFRHHQRKHQRTPHQFTGERKQRLLASLPFKPTTSQLEALSEIEGDFKSHERMLRLLQGDVGSGKTLVALLAMAQIIEAGSQAALMVPTEILARQHYESFLQFTHNSGIKIGLLTGKSKASERKETLEKLRVGEIDIIIGTHALFQLSVQFHKLGFVVIDEQHRFGVHQRMALSEKGHMPDILVMTATPIPRTLVLGYFGDMDVSTLKEKPAGRLPIDTRIIALERLDALISGVKNRLEAGDKIFWVCPLIEESEMLAMTSAEDRKGYLEQLFPGQVGLIHGRMTNEEKSETMTAFSEGKLRILVATTVIEVGVDIPDATIMVIENAQNFGLSQLHQLRGRVGRGDKASLCFLLYQSPLSETAKARLSVVRESEDGFRIAQEDLRLRGEGDLLGARQSGLPGYKIARIHEQQGLLETARNDAKLILTQDPYLKSERGKNLRNLLYIMGKETTLNYLQAG